MLIKPLRSIQCSHQRVIVQSVCCVNRVLKKNLPHHAKKFLRFFILCLRVNPWIILQHEIIYRSWSCPVELMHRSILVGWLEIQSLAFEPSLRKAPEWLSLEGGAEAHRWWLNVLFLAHNWSLVSHVACIGDDIDPNFLHRVLLSHPRATLFKRLVASLLIYRHGHVSLISAIAALKLLHFLAALVLHEFHQVRLASVVGELAWGRFEERSLILPFTNTTLDSLASGFLDHDCEVYVCICLALLHALAVALLTESSLHVCTLNVLFWVVKDHRWLLKNAELVRERPAFEQLSESRLSLGMEVLFCDLLPAFRVDLVYALRG